MENLQPKIEELEKRIDAIEAKILDPRWAQSQSARLAGSKRTLKKTEASRENGKKGGRPRSKNI